MRNTLIADYMNELIDFAGEKVPRHKAWLKLVEIAESNGYPNPHRLADTWMLGYDQTHRTKEK
jgi:hypothetical protein